VVNTQIMRCIQCYKKLIIGINPIIQVMKGLIFYCKSNGRNSLKKHVDPDHSFIAQMFKKEVNNLLKIIE